MNVRKRLVLAVTATAIGTGLAIAPVASAAPASASVVGAYGCKYTDSQPEISKGSSGAAVKEAQCLLKHWNVNIGPYGVDGSFGSDTDHAVREFQTRVKTMCHMPVDGIVGPKTWSALKHSAC
ncbi:serine/threonine protein kinase [Streptomyces sp. CB01201]|uniref:peptidoglycan-binding domain-containing protein n=1 Tax=Streptomyces sp. CB01201 TaxID=2020324 RepID=UPI000C277FF6|nr:peptidoglycan-binding domain-containing protein [Streptomyces sp. CB01201]PJM99882.1 serine/threonine protein kinase [Streptomyces sp. CB01201]